MSFTTPEQEAFETECLLATVERLKRERPFAKPHFYAACTEPVLQHLSRQGDRFAFYERLRRRVMVGS